MKNVCKTNIVKNLIESWNTAEIIPINNHWSCGVTVTRDDVLRFAAVLTFDNVNVSRVGGYCDLKTAKKHIIDYIVTKMLTDYYAHLDNERIDVSNIDIDALVDKFGKEYDFLYENYDRVAGYDEAMAYGDWLIKFRKDLVAALAKRRGDVLSSDREVAAFGFAVNELAA